VESERVTASNKGYVIIMFMLRQKRKSRFCNFSTFDWLLTFKDCDLLFPNLLQQRSNRLAIIYFQNNWYIHQNLNMVEIGTMIAVGSPEMIHVVVCRVPGPSIVTK
jgi:hypothetical protein